MVDEFAESENNSRVDSLSMHDQDNIPVVSKTSVKHKTSSNQERQK